MSRSAFALMSLACGLTCLTLASCDGNKSPDKPTTLRVGYIPIAECAHLYVGLSQKFFQHEGFKIDLVPMKGGAANLPALQQGDVDVGFSNVVSLILLDSKLPENDSKYIVGLVGASFERPNFTNHALLTTATSPITQKELSLPTTRIGLNTTRNIEELMLRRFMVRNKLDDSQLNLVPIAFPQMLSALERNEIDVASTVEPFIEPALRSGRYKLLAKHYQDVSDNTLVATYAVKRSWLDGNHAVATRLLRAFKNASDFMRNNDAETRQIIGSFTDIRREYLPIIGMAAYEAHITEKPVQELIDEMLRFGFINTRISPQSIIARVKD